MTRLDAVIRHWLPDKTIEVVDRRAPESTIHSGELKDTNGVSTPKRRFSDYQIDGINLLDGLDRFGGDRDAYMKVLRSYIANTKSLLASIKDVSEENLIDYAIVVHGIKGSSRSICADLVGDMAEVLEKAANEGDFGYVSEKKADLTQTVVKLLEDLGQMLVKMSAEAPRPKKITPDKDLLVKILEACYTFDMETVEAAVKELESYEYETNGELVPWLWDNVQQFNVDEIIGKLTEMNIGADSP
jgi:HPt (histidine-containing phosphotransfer) domain-containing protein